MRGPDVIIVRQRAILTGGYVQVAMRSATREVGLIEHPVR